MGFDCIVVYSLVENRSTSSDRTLVKDIHYGHLCEKLRPCAAKWEDIAMYLGFKAHEIASIRADPSKQMNAPASFMDYTIDMWSHWAPSDSRGSTGYSSLEGLKTALDKAGFPDIAQRLTLQ